jgi:hypothetical protein
MSNVPDDEERVSKKVIVEHSTSAGTNTGAIIAIIVIALIIIGFIVMQLNH